MSCNLFSSQDLWKTPLFRLILNWNKIGHFSKAESVSDSVNRFRVLWWPSPGRCRSPRFQKMALGKQCISDWVDNYYFSLDDSLSAVVTRFVITVEPGMFGGKRRLATLQINRFLHGFITALRIWIIFRFYFDFTSAFFTSVTGTIRHGFLLFFREFSNQSPAKNI